MLGCSISTGNRTARRVRVQLEGLEAGTGAEWRNGAVKFWIPLHYHLFLRRSSSSSAPHAITQPNAPQSPNAPLTLFHSCNKQALLRAHVPHDVLPRWHLRLPRIRRGSDLLERKARGTRGSSPSLLLHYRIELTGWVWRDREPTTPTRPTRFPSSFLLLILMPHRRLGSRRPASVRPLLPPLSPSPSAPYTPTNTPTMVELNRPQRRPPRKHLPRCALPLPPPFSPSLLLANHE